VARRVPARRVHKFAHRRGSLGKVYLANTAFLTVASDATAGTAGGNRSGGWSHDVFVISAGSNGIFETAIAIAGSNRGTTRVGNLIYIVSSDTR
jgi:hypothetical protein